MVSFKMTTKSVEPQKNHKIMFNKFQKKAFIFLGLLIIVIGFLVITIGTSNWYKRSISNSIREKGQKLSGVIEHLDCKSDKIAICNIKGSHVTIDLNDDCSKYNIGDTLLVYSYNNNFILSTFKIPVIKIIIPLASGILIMFFGFYLKRRLAL
jgi:hypothetical protein